MKLIQSGKMFNYRITFVLGFSIMLICNIFALTGVTETDMLKRTYTVYTDFTMNEVKSQSNPQMNSENVFNKVSTIKPQLIEVDYNLDGNIILNSGYHSTSFQEKEEIITNLFIAIAGLVLFAILFSKYNFIFSIIAGILIIIVGLLLINTNIYIALVIIISSIIFILNRVSDNL